MTDTWITFFLLFALIAAAAVMLGLYLRLTGRGLQEERLASLRLIQEEIARNREETSSSARLGREEMSKSIISFNDSLLSRMKDIAGLQKNQLDTFANQLAHMTQANEQRLENLRETVEKRLKSLQDENSQKLEQMRATVDEKLHATLEKRLGESFKLVSDRLEQVHKGLGEMQTLAAGVGDLKRVLTNVKTRGTWGEVQLGALLDQILTSEQYATNVVTRKGSNERVEYAIRLPGRDEGSGHEVWLPIDAKFPMEDYQRLLEAQEQADAASAEEAARNLETRIKNSARDIKEKYLDPPNTTDFGMMYLPTEGLYAEVIRRTGLMDTLQREYRVTVTGPTTLNAFLNSLQMGFRTLAIEKRSSDVWVLLGDVKKDFGRFGDILEKTKKKLQEASNTIDDAAKKSRTIERKLKQVQELPTPDAVQLIGETAQEESTENQEDDLHQP
ncbi:MAG: DNA recombination protein RmuC [bacterium]